MVLWFCRVQPFTDRAAVGRNATPESASHEACVKTDDPWTARKVQWDDESDSSEWLQSKKWHRPRHEKQVMNECDVIWCEAALVARQS